MTALAWLGFAAGLALVLATLASVMTTLIVPRGLSSRITVAVERVTAVAFVAVASRRSRYEQRDRLLALLGPVLLLALLTVWLTMFLVGFALMLLPYTGTSFPTALRVSGSSMFTLGFAVPDGVAPVVLVLFAAATGLVVIALQIAYLPVLYAAFNRRETLVTMLDSRGGLPAWGPEILARHELVDIVDSLPVLYAEWERWAADVAESHASYPMLLYFRSPHPKRSWVVALLAVLDAAALHNALRPYSAPSETRLVLRMGYIALRDVARVMGIPFNADPMPDDPVALTFEDFHVAVHHLEEAGWRAERDLEEGWRHFRGWRVNYEQIAYAVADRVGAPPAPWSGPRTRLGVPETRPERPVDRRPDPARQELFDVASLRRAGRPTSGYVQRRSHHDEPDGAPRAAPD